MRPGCKRSADEIYVKPAISFRAGHIIGNAQNQEQPTAAKTVLAANDQFHDLGIPTYSSVELS